MTTILGVWTWLFGVSADRCGTQCFGMLAVVVLLGTPLVITLVAVTFLRAGASSLFAAVGCVLTAGLLLPNLLAPLDLPVLAWPVILGLIASGYMKLEERAASGSRG